MTDFNFIDGTSNLSFDFGLSGEYTDFNFTVASDGLPDYDFLFGGGKVQIFRIFRGTSNNFNSIWADPKASLNSGKFYVGRKEDLTILENTNSQVCVEDFYSKTYKGRSNDTLNDVNVADINVIF